MPARAGRQWFPLAADRPALVCISGGSEMPDLVAVRLINKPIRGTPIGGEMSMTVAQARALVALGRAEYVTVKRPAKTRVRTRQPRRK